MKKIYRYILAAMAIASAAACAEQIENDSTLGQQETPEGLVPMTISAVSGDVTKTTFADRKVYWEETDAIIVFPMGESFTATIVSEDKAYAEFSGLADAAAENFYAVYPYSAGKSCTEGGDLTVSIPAEQTAVAGGFASGANVSVASFAKGDEAVTFQNVCTLLSFSFETDADAVLTKSVTIKAKNPAGGCWGIAGDVTVSFENGEMKVSAGNKESVVVNAPDGGFQKGVTYYVPVAPVGNIDGMELTYLHNDGETRCDRTNDTDDTFTRSNLFAMGAVPVAYDDLPQEVDVEIDFTGEWPLYPSCKAFEEQKKLDSDEYTYSHPYTYQGIQMTLPLPLKLEWRSNAYTYYRGYKHEDGALKHLAYTINDDGSFQAWNNSNASVYIILPTIKGRYLDRIDVLIGEYTHQSTMLQFNGLKTGTAVSLGEFSYSGDDNESTLSMELPKTKSKVQYGIYPNEGFEIKVRRGNMPIKKITLKYTKNIPVASN